MDGPRYGMKMQIKGFVSAVETAFYVNMRVYQHPAPSTNLTANPRPVSPSLFAMCRVWTTIQTRTRCL